MSAQQQSANPKKTMPHEVQIAFEKADLESDHAWFKQHWPIYSQPMGGHVLMSFPVFQWNGFRKWLQENPETFATKELLAALKSD